MSFFYPDQAYPGNDPFEVARQMGLNPMQALQMMQGGSGQMGGPQGAMSQFGGGMGGQQQFPDYDPNLIAEQVGQQYNPYQGYPTKQVSDQVWDVMGPTPEYLLPQLYNIQNPDAGGFDLDAFFQANPTLKGPLSEAYTRSEGDPIEMYAQLQSNEPIEGTNLEGETVMRPGIQDRLRQEVGREEWAGLAEQGYKPIIRAVNQGASPEELDDIAMDYYMGGLEDLLAAGSPTTQRAESQLDYTRQREGFRPAPGTGQQQPAYEGQGFGQPGMGASGGGTGADPLAALAQSPQYGGGGEGMSIGGRQFSIARETPEGVFVRQGGGGADTNSAGSRVADLLRSGEYRNIKSRRPGQNRRQDANGGGRESSGRSRNIAQRGFSEGLISLMFGGRGKRKNVSYSRRNPSQNWQGLSSRQRNS